MKKFTYLITHPMGMHAQVVGQLAILAKQFPKTTITVECKDREARLDQVLKMMSLAVNAGEQVIVRAEGEEPEETEAFHTVKDFFEKNL